MPRSPRIIVPNGLYHVTARGNRRQAVFIDDRDRNTFLLLLERVSAALRWHCYGFCLMPNHYHLVVETPNADLSAGLQRLNSRYAEAFNRRHEVGGHLFQGRFHAVAVESDWHLLELSRYLALNPVRAGLCRTPADWRWSSYRAVLALAGAPSFLAVDRVLRHFGRDSARARRAFHAFVADAAAAKPVEGAL
jgi:REP element-mobilizing transposase RayT